MYLPPPLFFFACVRSMRVRHSLLWNDELLEDRNLAHERCLARTMTA